MPEFRKLPIALIDPPAKAVRRSFDDEAMADLMQSITDVGLIEPIVVKETAGRFEVLAGHRRLVACQQLGHVEIACVVREDGAAAGEAVKVHENAVREAVNAAEEAQHFQELLVDHCDNDTDKLCALVRKSRAYVEGRLNL